MRDVDFEAILAEINRDSFFMKKLSTLKLLISNELTYLNTEQVITLLNNISDAKLQVVETVVDRIADLNDENRAKIMDECNSFSVRDKTTLEQLLDSHQPKPMTPREFRIQQHLSDADFEAIKTEVKGASGATHQLDILRILVAGERTFVSTQQVIELMNLIQSQKGAVLETLQDKIVDYYPANIIALTNECDSFHIIESFIKRAPKRQVFAPITDVQPAMGDEEFELIVKEITDLKSTKQKVDRLKLYCDNAFTYFSCAQVARLMQATGATVSVVEAVKDRVVDFSIANVLSLAHHCNTPKGKWDLVTSLINLHPLQKVDEAEAAAASSSAAASSEGDAKPAGMPLSPRSSSAQVVSDADFEELLNEIKKSKSAKGQLTKVKAFVDAKSEAHFNFTPAQVIALLSAVKSGKYEIAEMMHNKIVDLSVPNLIAIGNTQATSKGKQKIMDVITGKMTALQIAEAEKAAKADKAAAAAAASTAE